MRRHTIHESEVQAMDRPGRKVRVIIGPDAFGPCKSMNMGIAEFPQGVLAPEHVHETQEEISYVIAGEGEFHIRGATERLAPGVCVYIPPGIPHQTRNTGDHVLKVLYVFSPAHEVGES